MSQNVTSLTIDDEICQVKIQALRDFYGPRSTPLYAEYELNHYVVLRSDVDTNYCKEDEEDCQPWYQYPYLDCIQEQYPYLDLVAIERLQELQYYKDLEEWSLSKTMKSEGKGICANSMVCM